MKKLCVLFVLSLLLTSLPTFAMAEDSKNDPTETVEAEGESEGTDETLEEMDETDEADESQESLVTIYKAPKKLPDGWQTNKRPDIEDEITEVYTCPVRKERVYMKFFRSFGITKMRVWIQVLKEGEWVNAANTDGLQLGKTIAFVFDGPYRYRIFAKRLKGSPLNRRCELKFVGIAD